MKVQPINYKDLTEERNEFLFKLPFVEACFLPILAEKEDIAMIHLLSNIILVPLPSAILLFALDNPPHWLGFLHVLVMCLAFLQRFLLTLHYSSHRSIFRDKMFKNVFNFNMHYILCPLFGIPPGTYRLHHCVMHHVENNVVPYDISSTMTYQRDSIFHFSCYWARYTFAIWFQLPYYAYIRNRNSLLYYFLTTLVTYFTFLFFCFKYNPTATFWVFFFPFLVTSVIIMLGNWCQHILVDPTRYDDSYALTYNIINSPMNKLTYNDGYHIVHHIQSQLHWSKLPQYFLDNQDKFLQNGCITFEGLDYVEIGVLLFLGRYEQLAKHYVHLGPPESRKSDKEVVELFKEWVKPIQPRLDVKVPEK